MPDDPDRRSPDPLQDGRRDGGRAQGAGGPLLPVRALPARRVLARRFAAREPPGRLEQLDIAAVERRLPREHQPPDELLAGRGHQPRRDDRAVLRLRRLARPAGRGHRARDVRQPRLGRAQRDDAVRLHGHPRLGDVVLVPGGRRLARAALLRPLSLHAGRAVPARAGLPADAGALGVLDRRAGRRSAGRQARRQPELLARAGPVQRGRRDVAADRLGPVQQHAQGGAGAGARRRVHPAARGHDGQARPRPARSGRGASCRSGRRTGTTRTTTTVTSRTCSRCTPATRSTRSTTRSSRGPRRSRCGRAATAGRAGARPGRSTSGRGCSTATTRTRCCPSSSRARRSRTSGTRTRRSRSTATSGPRPASRRCCCRATARSSTCCPPSRAPGIRARSPGCVRAAT